MNHIGIHPAPGIGDMLPGWWAVPQNPITAAAAKYNPRMGELLPGSFVVPQNPILASLSHGVNNSSMGCASCQYTRNNMGMGDLGYFDSWSPTAWTWQEWATVGVGVLLVLSMLRPGQSQYKAAVSSAKDQYRKAVASARAKYPRVAGRVKRAYSAAAEAL